MTWRYAVRGLSIAGTALSGAWFYLSPGFEPAIATILGIAGVISSFLTERGSASLASPPVSADLRAQPQRATVSRSQVERFLDDLSYWEDGPRFQALAVVLAKKRWRDLVASERKWDRGLDAYAPPDPGNRKTGKGLASSLTGTLDKVKKDAERASASFPDLGVLIFYTPQKVTNHTARKWAEEIRSSFALELIVVGREDLILDLIDPSNAALCGSLLGLTAPISDETRDNLARARQSAREIAENWLRASRADTPLVRLRLALLDEQDSIATSLDLAALLAELGSGRHLILEAPAGSGKTTTISQLASLETDSARLSLLVELPRWIASRKQILEYVADQPSFQSRGVRAADIALLSDQLNFLLNGWNEIPESDYETAAAQLRELDRHFPAAGILLATRSHRIPPPLSRAAKLTIRPLSNSEQREYVTLALGGNADALLARISGDPTLDDLTRTPLLLAEVVKLHQAARPIPKTRLEILAAMAKRIEESQEHQNRLESPPLLGCAKTYLTALAVEMTASGQVDLSDERARSCVARASEELKQREQIATIPEHASVLDTLSAHHVLQHFDGEAAGYRFHHQQFQEHYAAFWVMTRLAKLASNPMEERIRALQADVLDQPVWQEALTMVAEHLGSGTPSIGSVADAIQMGASLVRWAIPVDPIFAASLARSCGSRVWEQVRERLGQVLRDWHASPDPHHQRCALAAILASGSFDFRDIVVPLLTHSDGQVRLSSYRALGPFHLSSLGPHWQELVTEWGDDQRADFLGEVATAEGRPAAEFVAFAERLAAVDPSRKVRLQALDSLRWIGASEALERLYGAIADEDLNHIGRGVDPGELPPALRARIAGVARELLKSAGAPDVDLRLLLRAQEFGDIRAVQDIESLLIALAPAELARLDFGLLSAALAAIRKADPQWSDAWISDQVANGSLWADRWLNRVNAVPTHLVSAALEKLTAEELEPRECEGAVAVLVKAADTALATEIWSRLIDLADRTRKIRDQLKQLIRALPPSLLASGALRSISHPPKPTELETVIDVLGELGDENQEFREGLTPEERNALGAVLVSAVTPVLQQEDFHGRHKATLALALGRIGRPADIQSLRRLVFADIERVRAGLAALARREHGPQAEGARTSWAGWHVKAISWLGTDVAEPLLLELLSEAEYEVDAAEALSRVALGEPSRGLLGFGLTAERMQGIPPAVADETLRRRYAAAIGERVRSLLAERRAQGEAYSTQRIKKLAAVLARLDGAISRDLVLEVMALPGSWDGWTRVAALTELVRYDTRLPTDRALAALNPAIEEVMRSGLHNDQSVYLLLRSLRILPFLEDEADGISRMREVIQSSGLPVYELREIVPALGARGSEQALSFLLELASLPPRSFETFVREWAAAVASIDLPAAKEALVSFLEDDARATAALSSGAADVIAARIGAIANREPGLCSRVRRLCERSPSPGQRQMLAKTVAEIGALDVLMAGLNLIGDSERPPVPFELERAIERVLVEHHPLADRRGMFTPVPKAGAEMRKKLFELALSDARRRRSALALLGQIDELRLDYGKPELETRHPKLSSGHPWPPLGLFAAP